MSFVTTQPETLSSAATALGGIGSSFNAQNAAASAPNHRGGSRRGRPGVGANCRAVCRARSCNRRSLRRLRRSTSSS